MQPTLTGAPFGIVKPQSFYTIGGVLLPTGAYGDVQVTERRLDGGRSRTQAGWVDYWRQTGWGIGSGPLRTATIKTLFGNKDDKDVEELRSLFAEDFREAVITSTRVTYRAEGLDLITHDAGMPEERTLEARLVGPDGRVNAEMSDVMQALLGNGNAGQVRDVYRWVTGRGEPYLWRFNKRPKQDTERALVLGDYFVGFDVVAVGYVGGGWPARGVRVAPQSSTGSKG